MSNFSVFYNSTQVTRQIWYNVEGTRFLWFTEFDNNTIKYASSPTSINTITDVSGSISITTIPNGSRAYTLPFNGSGTQIHITNTSNGLVTKLNISGQTTITTFTNLIFDND
jgi:hypothetical protein